MKSPCLPSWGQATAFTPTSSSAVARNGGDAKPTSGSGETTWKTCFFFKWDFQWILMGFYEIWWDLGRVNGFYWDLMGFWWGSNGIRWDFGILMGYLISSLILMMWGKWGISYSIGIEGTLDGVK